MEKILKVQMAAELENQGLARAVAAAYASELDPTVEELTEIKTAVSEAFSNAAIHGYPDGSYGNGASVYDGYRRGEVRHGVYGYGKFHG